MHWDIQSTICAIATGSVGAARGAIRISGPNTLAILGSIVPGADFSGIKKATRVVVAFPLGAPFGSLEVDLWLWPNQRSYTGAPAAELHMVGNQVLLNRAVQVLVQHGAKVAEPGEFTLRAFLSGRMDLTQCEAVLGAVNASSDRQFEVALHQLAGGLSHPLQLVRATLINLLADIEAGLDFVDEDIEFISKGDVLARIEGAESAIRAILVQMSQRDGPETRTDVVLAGRPNAGKSSLINALTSSNTAIVNDQPGTTRDYLRVPLERNGQVIYLVDTAGMELHIGAGDDSGADSVDNDTIYSQQVNKMHVDVLAESMTNHQRDSARLVLYCIDSTLDPYSKQIEIDSYLRLYQQYSNTWLIWTKSEDKTKWNCDEKRIDSTRCFETSSLLGHGLRELEDALSLWYESEADEAATVVASTASRCLSSLEAAAVALQGARLAADEDANELVAGELRLALEALGRVAGVVYDDDILDALFSRFCIGK